MSEFDFLNASDQAFSSATDMFQYVDEEDVLDDVGSNVNLIGSVNNYQSRSGFLKSVNDYFEKIWEEDDLFLLAAHTENRAIPYYVYFDDDFPVFVTTANISDEMPDTIQEFLTSDPDLGRFWISMHEMDRMRKKVVQKDPDVTIPFFTGHRSKYSDVPAEKRDGIKRTITYWAIDGRETYKEFRKKYGVLPTNIRFERPGQYKFGLKQEGIISHQEGSILRAWDVIRSETEDKKGLKDTINTGGYSSQQSTVFSNQDISASNPWAIRMPEGPHSSALDTFEARLQEERWKFGISDFDKSTSYRFDAEVIDNEQFGRTEMQGGENQIRIFPIDGNDIDPQFRLFNFVQDHFDSSCKPVEV